ncbi:unnamed protein product [Caenorhabditis angaria]|uniref:Uncharacterized protein n=1 Tax=Caenorhabditis angaria TaxID=860376 RepID=A0A9P1IGH9_9PELO|nr:unnamed protein product [Caenorhabditis angaria]
MNKAPKRVILQKDPNGPPVLKPEQPPLKRFTYADSNIPSSSNNSRIYVNVGKSGSNKASTSQINQRDMQLLLSVYQRNGKSSIRTVSEAARVNGLQTVAHTSGAKFAVPLTCQAHPIRLTDRIPDESNDIVNQNEALPYCRYCHSVIKTWQGYEYHVLQAHIKYRAFRCIQCPRESFFTEEEGRFHISVHHPDCQVALVKDFDQVKEEMANEFFKKPLMMMRDGPSVTTTKIKSIQRKAALEVMKFHRLRFKEPIVVVRKGLKVDKNTQTAGGEVAKPIRRYQNIIAHNPYDVVRYAETQRRTMNRADYAKYWNFKS